MPNQGYFDKYVPPRSIFLNLLFLQKGDIGDFDDQFTGMWVFDTTTMLHHRANGLSFDVILDVDASAATPSLRTLGTGSSQAAAGNHSH